MESLYEGETFSVMLNNIFLLSQLNFNAATGPNAAGEALNGYF